MLSNVILDTLLWLSYTQRIQKQALVKTERILILKSTAKWAARGRGELCVAVGAVKEKGFRYLRGKEESDV
jgi:hypothetical protein